MFKSLIHFLKNKLVLHPEIKYIFGWFLLTRIYLGIIGVLARIFIKSPHNFIYSKHIWLAIWGVWDSGWYLPLAKYGYSAIASTREATFNQANYAFFPLYPLLMRGLSYIIHDYFVAGLIISNIALVTACVYLYKLASLDFDNKTALQSVKFSLLWPVSFILSGVFTESLYLMLAVMTFYYARKKYWLTACVLGFFLALTRSVGVLIVIPLLFEFFSTIKFDFKKTGKQLFYFFLIPLGLGLFSYYNYQLTKDPIAFLKIQYAWGRHIENPIRVLVGGFLSGDTIPVFNALYTVITIAFVLFFYKIFRPSYLIFIGYSILIPLFSSLESLPRYMLVIFPVFLLAAETSKKRFVNISLSLGLALIQAILMIFWTTGFNLVK